MFTGIEVPLEVAGLLCALCLGAGLAAGRWPMQRSQERQRSPLDAMLHPATLGPAIDLASRRNAMREASRAVLYGRIDQLAGLREEMRGQVADVMRAGLRRGDHFEGIAGDGFTIVIPGADERSATRIADRLRRSLDRLRHAHPGLTASFGVAAGDAGEGSDTIAMRARQALQAAIARGEDHVIAASEIEEVIYLPAPAPSQVASAA